MNNKKLLKVLIACIAAVFFACAVTVASILNGYTNRLVTVKLLGGDLFVEWEEQTGIVYMTGSATHVFDGEIAL